MRVAVLEDDRTLIERLTRLVENAGHQVWGFRTGGELLESLKQNSFDLLLLDWFLPDMSGIDVLKWVRDHLDPVPAAIMLTIRAREADIVAALLGGADDYLTKPFCDSVLRARMEAVLRRVYKFSDSDKIERFGKLVFQAAGRNVEVDGSPVLLTAKEFDLALLLFRNLGRPLSRKFIMETVWSRPDIESRTLDAHISQIRNRLGLRPEQGVRLSSVYGFGYRLERVEDELTPG